MSATGGALGIGSASDEVETTLVHQIEKDSSFDRRASLSEITTEKGEVVDFIDRVDTETEEDDNIALSHEVQFPIDPNAVEEQQFTFRAVFVGCCLGGVIAASK